MGTSEHDAKPRRGKERGNRVFQTVISMVSQPEHSHKFKHLRDAPPPNPSRRIAIRNVSSRLKSLARKKPAKITRKRSDMGHYIFDMKKGQVPLTVRDLPVPGPADYAPDYTKIASVRRIPAYSLANWTKEVSSADVSPGPKYHVAQDSLSSSYHQVTLKGRTRQPSVSAGSDGPGPAAYNVKVKAIGTQQQHVKTTLKGRTASKYRAGLSTRLHMACESSGFVNAHELMHIRKTRQSQALGDGPKLKFNSRRRRDDTTIGPGPGLLMLTNKQQNCSQGKTLGSRYALPEPDAPSPGPAIYNVPLSDKTKYPNALVLPRREPIDARAAPAPNEYIIRTASDRLSRAYDWRGPHITFRQHADSKDNSPSPCHYNPTRKYRAPGGSIAGAHVPPYPDCLNYQLHLKSRQSVPAAASYNPDNHCIKKNSCPKHSFGIRHTIRNSHEEGVGPADYDVRDLTKLGRATAPQHSLGGLTMRHSLGGQIACSNTMMKTEIPGPGAYNVTSKAASPAYTMSGRNDKNMATKVGGIRQLPGPQYNLRGLTRAGTGKPKLGIQLKSRHSPHVYPGMDLHSHPLPSAVHAANKWSDSVHLG